MNTKKKQLTNLQEKYLKIVTDKKLKLPNKKMLLLIKELENKIINGNIFIIGIDGKSGGGKSTISKVLQELFNANLFHVDDFFKKPFINPNDPFSKYGSNIDFNKITNNIMKPILTKTNSKYQPFDFKTHTHLDYINVKHNNINIIEGSFSLHPYLFNNYNYTIYLSVNYFKQLFRINKRSGFKRLLTFIKKWIPNENKYNRDLKISKKIDFYIKI